MVKCVSILGSTGSIGRQSLDIISRLPEIRVAALTAGTSVERMAEQCRAFRPELAVMATQEAAEMLSQEIQDLPIRVNWGEEGLIEAATMADADCVITAVVGMVGLKPTLAAIGRRSASVLPIRRPWSAPARSSWRRRRSTARRSFPWILSIPPFSSALWAAGTEKK